MDAALKSRRPEAQWVRRLIEGKLRMLSRSRSPEHKTMYPVESLHESMSVSERGAAELVVRSSVPLLVTIHCTSRDSPSCPLESSSEHYY